MFSSPVLQSRSVRSPHRMSIGGPVCFVMHSGGGVLNLLLSGSGCPVCGLCGCPPTGQSPLNVLTLENANSLYVTDICPDDIFQVYIHFHIFQIGKCLGFIQKEGKVVVLPGVCQPALPGPCALGFGNSEKKQNSPMPMLEWLYQPDHPLES